jgi:hypothetical protein
MNRALSILLAAVSLSTALSDRAHATDPDVASPLAGYQYLDSPVDPPEQPNITSPLTNYQYLDSLTEPPAQPNIITPLVSYQYFDWPGDENLTFQSSPNVSYFFSGGVSLSLIGMVRTEAGIPIAGATIALKRYGTAFWQAITPANGNYYAPGLPAANYTAVVTKPGYSTLIASYGGEAGGNGMLNFTLRALPTVAGAVTTNLTPPSTAVRPPAPANPADPNAPKLLAYNATTQLFGNNLSNLSASRPTVVITHGWLSDPDSWVTDLARRIVQNSISRNVTPPNIVAWDWRNLTKFSAMKSPSTDVAWTQGEQLGKVLQASPLGTSYSQHLHFIGHSLGALVNSCACDYLHGGLSRNSANSPSRWDSSQTRPHVTVLDEAEAAAVFGHLVNVYKNVADKDAEFRSAIRREIDIAVADWKYPVPKKAAWTDNYISAYGIQQSTAVNVCLVKPALFYDRADPNTYIAAHTYAHEWYRGAMTPTGIPPEISFGLAEEAGAVFPPTATWHRPGDLWVEDLLTFDSFDQLPVPTPTDYESNILILSAFVMPSKARLVVQGGAGAAKIADATGRGVMNTYAAGIEMAGEVGGTVIYKTGQVWMEAKEKVGNLWDAALDAGSNLWDRLNPDESFSGDAVTASLAVNLQSQPSAAFAKARMTSAAIGIPPGIPAHAWMTVDVPANAGLVAFDFTVTGEPQEDSIACAVNGQNIFTLPAKFAPDASPVSTDMMDISEYAGQTVQLFFGLVGGGSTNCTLTVDGIRFITIPEPQVGLAASGPNVAVKWPAAAVGWVLETSDTLAPDSWQPVTMAGVTVESGVATLEQPVSGPKKFYRLRRNP